MYIYIREMKRDRDIERESFGKRRERERGGIYREGGEPQPWKYTCWPRITATNRLPREQSLGWRRSTSNHLDEKQALGLRRLRAIAWSREQSIGQ